MEHLEWGMVELEKGVDRSRTGMEESETDTTRTPILKITSWLRKNRTSNVRGVGTSQRKGSSVNKKLEHARTVYSSKPGKKREGKSRFAKKWQKEGRGGDLGRGFLKLSDTHWKATRKHMWGEGGKKKKNQENEKPMGGRGVK